MARQQASVRVAILDFVRVENKVLVRIVTPELGNESLEYFDGTNSLFGRTQVQNKPIPAFANLIRDTSEVLSHSARRTQEARFLLGIPLTQNFSQYNPAVTSQKAKFQTEPHGEVKMEASDARGAEFTFSEAHGSLTSFREESVDPARNKGVPYIVAEDFREYGKGLWFPSKVIYTAPYGTSEYTLVKAEFNDEVDPADVLLPAGLRINDWRFGTAIPAVTYPLQDGQLPSDAEIKKRLGLKEDEDIAKAKAKQDQTEQARNMPVSEAALPLLGLICMGFGVALWRRANKMEA